MKDSLLFLLLLFWLNACNHIESVSEFIDIEIAEAYTQNRTIELSKIIEGKIEYISLETKGDLILASPSRVYFLKVKLLFLHQGKYSCLIGKLVNLSEKLVVMKKVLAVIWLHYFPSLLIQSLK
jgi:hypothetical protein